MYNPQPSLLAGRAPGKAPKGQGAFADERTGNEQIRELLRTFGLRTSLIRLKVIDALHAADRNGRSIGVRGVHAQLEQLDIPLSFLSVREVLKRLCSEGVIQLGSDKCYSLAPRRAPYWNKRPRAERLAGQAWPARAGQGLTLRRRMPLITTTTTAMAMASIWNVCSLIVPCFCRWDRPSIRPSTTSMIRSEYLRRCTCVIEGSLQHQGQMARNEPRQ